MDWIIVKTGKRSASENMALDAALLEDLEELKSPILHFYEWEKEAATFGYFIDPARYLNMEAVESLKLDLAKRPTGGGIVFHQCDLAFSVLIPSSHPSFSLNPLENYAFVNKHVIKAIKKLLKEETPALLPEEPVALDANCQHFCMAKPTKYDVMINGRKVGGAAQRKLRHGYLHQGSISLGMLPDAYLKEILRPETLVLEGMKKNSYPLLDVHWDKKSLEEMRMALSFLLEEIFKESSHE